LSRNSKRSKKIKQQSLLSISILLLLLSTGCRDDAPIAPATFPEQPLKEAAPQATFGIIYPMAHPFYEMITLFAEEAARPERIQLIVKAPDEANLEQQIRMMETLIQQQVDGIAIAPVNSHALVPVINKAVDAGIPVICFESDAPDSRRLSFLGTDNYAAGIRMGEVLGTLLNQRGMVLVETGMSKMSSLQDRLEGMLHYIGKETDIQVLEVRYNEGNEDVAMIDMEAMIDAHPHFDALVALDFVSGSTSVLVWKAKGLSRYALTFGMMPDIQEAIENGQIVSAVSQNEHEWGRQIVDLLLQASLGSDIPAFQDTGSVEITKQSLDSVPNLK
jgi:ribose transport system substrate-binding protein